MGDEEEEGGRATTSALLLARDSTVNEVPEDGLAKSRSTDLSVLVWFWILGVLNNSSYVIMIASAKSISSGGVALVYISAIIPGMMMKMTAPFWFDRVGYFARLTAATTFMVGSFALVGPLSFGRMGTQLCGVLLCSLQSSLGEASLLALASRYPERGSGALGAWSSGTGMAGIFGYAWVFLFRSALDVSQAAMQSVAMCTLPACYAVSFLALLRGAPAPPASECDGAPLSPGRPSLGDTTKPNAVPLSFCQRLRFGLSLWPITGAIFSVYFAEYAMQSGVWAAMGFPRPTGPKGEHRRNAFYLYSNWLYQCGVLVSRSSGFLWNRPVPKRVLWAMALAQCGLLVFFAADAADHFW